MALRGHAKPRIAPVVVAVALRCMALATLAWVVLVWPSARTLAALDGYAKQIANGAIFRSETLLALRPELDEADRAPIAHPRLSRDVALIELRLAELFMRGRDDARASAQLVRAEAATRQALASNPADGFLWFAMFWLAKQNRGFEPADLDFLDRSYASSAHEGWIAVHRDGEAVTVLPLLTPALRARVVDEFCDLVAANYIDDAANILTGPGWPRRNELLGCLDKAGLDQRRALAQRLEGRGVDLLVPGVARRPERPWEFSPG